MATIFISNLPLDVTDQELHSYFPNSLSATVSLKACYTRFLIG